jgi:acetyl-CoA C-acetyltransferase
MGQTAENVAELENVSREEMDEFAALSQQRAVAAQENGFFDREIIPVTLPTEPCEKDDGPRAGTTARSSPASSPCSGPTAGHRRQRGPLNDGAPLSW